MGTSAVLMTKKDNKIKTLQYQSMDGYISGAGIGIFKNLKLADIDNIKKKNIYYFDEQITQILKNNLNKRPSEVTIEIPPILLLSCADVIEYLNETNQEKIGVIEYDYEWIEFENYLYIIDFDENVFQIYENHFSDYECKNCLKIGEITFKKFERICECKLDNLPSVKQFKNLVDID